MAASRKEGSSAHLGSVKGRDPGPALSPDARETYSNYRLAIRLPEGTVAALFSRRYPSLRIEIHNRMEIDDGLLLVEGKVFGAGGINFAEEVLRYPGVTNLELRSEGPGVAHYRLTQVIPEIHEVIRRHQILTRYPVVIQNEWLRFETVATPSQVRAVLAELRRRIGRSRIETARQGTVPLNRLGLTPAQERLFRAAISEGYYDIPRRITLTGLAVRVGQSKSTVSESLAKIRKHFTEAALHLAGIAFPGSP